MPLTLSLLVLGAALAAAHPHQPTEAQHYVRLGMEAAGKDRHEAAIFYLRRAVELDTTVVAQVGKELGNQYTWADKADSAIVWYEAYLVEHPDDIEAEIGLARALSWSDRHDEALAMYQRILAQEPDHEEEVRVAIAKITSWQDKLLTAETLYDSVLVDHPDNLEARIGLAQTINWSGRHREAAILYNELLVEHPDNAEVRDGLANAYQWMGRPDLALEVLGDAPGDASGQEIAVEIHRSRSPAFTYGYFDNRDSDEVHRRQHLIRAAFSPQDLTRGQALYSHWKISEETLPEVSRNQLGAVLERRFSNLLAASALLGWEWNQYDLGTLASNPDYKSEFNLPLIDAYATFTPRDWLRSDVSLYHGALTNPIPIYRNIAVTALAGSVDWRFHPTMMTVGVLSWSRYSDTNQRLALSGRYDWNPIWQAPVGTRNRFTLITYAGYMGFTESPDHGYYSPDRFYILYERVEWLFNFGNVVNLMLAGRVGAEWDTEWYDVGALDGYVSWRIVPDLGLTLGYYNNQSRIESQTGYDIQGWYLTLDYLFVR
jgi:tetratricopeptide (TPR) repeat protein